MQTATADIVAGFKRIGLASALALEDLKDRYRRSYVGLAWITLSFIAFIVVKGLIFRGLFDTPGYDYFSHLVIGFALFGFISAMIAGGTSLFISNRTWILSSNLPYTVYAHNLVIRGLAELGLISVAATILILAIGNVDPAYIWTVPFALVLYYATGLALCLGFGPIGAAKRDFVYAVQTVNRLLLFASPVIWVPAPGTFRGTIATWNPLTYYLDIIRVPVIEGRLPVASWGVCLTLSAFLIVLSLLIFARTKREIPLWL